MRTGPSWTWWRSWWPLPRPRRVSGTRLMEDPLVTSIASRHTDGDGEIVVVPPADAVAPVRTHWHGLSTGSHVVEGSMRACRLPPGAYSVQVEDARGCRSNAIPVRVESALVPTICSYEILHASSDDTFDARVEAVVANLSGAEQAECVYLWTTGARTTAPVLEGARTGTYAVLLVQLAGQPTPCLHACPPAVVEVQEGAP